VDDARVRDGDAERGAGATHDAIVDDVVEERVRVRRAIGRRAMSRGAWTRIERRWTGRGVAARERRRRVSGRARARGG
jgi:hypothetical protein